MGVITNYIKMFIFNYEGNTNNEHCRHQEDVCLSVNYIHIYIHHQQDVYQLVHMNARGQVMEKKKEEATAFIILKKKTLN